jgi:hypothetical protein
LAAISGISFECRLLLYNTPHQLIWVKFHLTGGISNFGIYSRNQAADKEKVYFLSSTLGFLHIFLLNFLSQSLHFFYIAAIKVYSY